MRSLFRISQAWCLNNTRYYHSLDSKSHESRDFYVLLISLPSALRHRGYLISICWVNRQRDGSTGLENCDYYHLLGGTPFKSSRVKTSRLVILLGFFTICLFFLALSPSSSHSHHPSLDTRYSLCSVLTGWHFKLPPSRLPWSGETIAWTQDIAQHSRIHTHELKN